MTHRTRSRPYGLNKRKPLGPAPPFTAKSVQQHIEAALRGPKNVRSGGSMPDGKEIKRLTAAMNKLHSLCFAAQQKREEAGTTPGAKGLFKRLRKILPELDEYGRAAAEHAPKVYLRSIDGCSQAIRHFLGCGAMFGALHVQSLSEQIRGWQFCWGSLLRIIPTDSIGVNAMARLIAATAPALSGEHPKPESVKQWLLKQNRQ